MLVCSSKSVFTKNAHLGVWIWTYDHVICLMTTLTMVKNQAQPHSVLTYNRNDLRLKFRSQLWL